MVELVTRVINPDKATKLEFILTGVRWGEEFKTIGFGAMEAMGEPRSSDVVPLLLAD